MTTTGAMLDEQCDRLANIVGEEHAKPVEAVTCAPADAAQISEILGFANANSLSSPPGKRNKDSLGQSCGHRHSTGTGAIEQPARTPLAGHDLHRRSRLHLGSDASGTRKARPDGGARSLVAGDGRPSAVSSPRTMAALCDSSMTEAFAI